MFPISMIVVTGGDCAGKSTFLKQAVSLMRGHAYRVLTIDEAATHLIARGISPLSCDNRSFQEQVLRLQLEREALALHEAAALSQEAPVVIFCDRGTLDGLAYIERSAFEEIVRGCDFSIDGLMLRYTQVVHLVTAADGAEEYYSVTQNPVRLQTGSRTPAQARELDKRLQHAWAGHPKHVIIDNRIDFDFKLFRALQAFGRVLALPQPLEAERLFIFRNYKPRLLPPEAPYADLCQHYLRPLDGVKNRRVRRSVFPSGTTILHYTEKVKTEVPGIRIERERVISAQEYFAHRRQDRDLDYQPLNKRRISVAFGNHVLQVDVPPLGRQRKKGIVRVEVELPPADWKTPILFPPAWEVEEVTGDPRYSARAMARRAA